MAWIAAAFILSNTSKMAMYSASSRVGHMDDAARTTDDVFSRLTSVQRTCLRLVARGLTSIEIAQETGLPYLRIERHISRARALLGSVNRREAARQFVAWEQSQLAEAQPGPVEVEPGPEPVAAGPGTSAMRRGWHAAMRPLRARANCLTSSQRVYTILRIAAFSAAAVTAIALVTAGIRNF